jgi:hypothetical protein
MKFHVLGLENEQIKTILTMHELEVSFFEIFLPSTLLPLKKKKGDG